jgi:hypothetical protein
MKAPVFPLLCAAALVLMAGAVASHWWSVRQFASTMRSSPLPTVIAAPAPALPKSAPAASAPAPVIQSTAAAADSKQQEFYAALLARMESLQNQNRDLLDQLAETNRDLMKLEFRVDTHSESFRPLPVSEEQPFTSLDSDLGVLPPRDESDLPQLHD